MAVYQLVRGGREPLLDNTRRLPANLLASVQDWIGPFFWIGDPMGGRPDFRRDVLRDLERKLGVSVPFDPASDKEAISDLQERVARSEEFAIKTLAILLSEATPREGGSLAEIFEAPGSIWEVMGVEDGNCRIVLRQSGPVTSVVVGLAEFSTPAARHLDNALERLSRPGEKDPVGAYAEAIKAVEAAARPAVTPKDPIATLGKMIAALEAKPSKWGVTLADERVEDVARRAAILWNTPHERHGSNDPQPPVTVAQAQAGFALALGLVDYFARGLIYRVE
ncbi:MAG: hypothetical protein ABW065_02410 [Solirubrobacterales bacterium]